MTEEAQATPEGSNQPVGHADQINSLLSEVAAMQAEIATLQASLRDQQLRSAAEVENMRKRAERDVDNGRKYGAERVLGDLLAICDSIDLGFKAARAPDASAKAIADGIELTQKQLTSLLEKNGVKPIDPVGEPFNPDFHEAVSTMPSAEVAPNHVVAVMHKGYRLHERLLRPAMVLVSKAAG